jgi:spermidine synthase
MPLVLIALFLWGTPGADKSTQGLIFEGESAYNYIQVLEEDDFRLLRLNEGQGVHSIYHPTILNFNGPWEQVMSAPFFNPAPVVPSSIKSAAIIGLAAGTTSRELFAVFPRVKIDGVEIDPLIVEVGKRYFNMENPNLNVIVQDGRWALERSTEKYQVISIDAYRPPYIPWHMTTVEFFQSVRAHLTEDGVMVINIGRGPTDRRLVDALAATIRQVFPSIYISDISGSFNTLLFATVQKTSLENYLANYVHLMENPNTPPLLLEVLAATYEGLQPLPENESLVFTDDHAPVEQITNSIVLNFLFSGGTKDLE